VGKNTNPVLAKAREKGNKTTKDEEKREIMPCLILPSQKRKKKKARLRGNEPSAGKKKVREIFPYSCREGSKRACARVFLYSR